MSKAESPQQDKKLKMSSIVNFEQLYLQEKALRIQLQRQLETEKLRFKKMASGRGRMKVCPMCLQDQSEKKSGTLIEDLKDFSSKMSSVIHFPSTIEVVEPGLSCSTMSSAIYDASNKEGNEKKHLSMIDNFAVFGVSQETIRSQSRHDKPQQLQSQVLFSKKLASNAQFAAANWVFPSGTAIKRLGGLKAKQKTIELMSLCYTNLKSFVMIFEPQIKNFETTYHKNDLLNHLNPSKKLFCVCIGIHDYTGIEPVTEKFNISLGEICNNDQGISSKSQIKSQVMDGQLSHNGSDSIKQLQQVDLQVAISQRVFCIMSYFPFFTFYEQILRNLINNIKMQRLAIYKHNEQNIRQTIKQTDSSFQLSRMQQLFLQCSGDLCNRKVQFNRNYQLKLISQQKITLMTDWIYAKTYFIDQWIFSVLNMFTYDTFLDLFTLVMLDDQIVFVCDNSNILSHTIYLFAEILTKPFKYAHPVVTILLDDEDWLHATGPVIYGMLKKRKVVEERRIVERYDKTYVFLSPDKVEVLYAEDRKALLKRRPTKLVMIKDLFRDLKKSRKKEPRTTKYEIETNEYCIMASKEEKEHSVAIINHVNEFVLEEIIKKLPSQLEIENIRSRMDPSSVPQDKDYDSHFVKVICSNIRKHNKDSFLEKFIETQTLNNYLFAQDGGRK